MSDSEEQAGLELMRWLDGYMSKECPKEYEAMESYLGSAFENERALTLEMMRRATGQMEWGWGDPPTTPDSEAVEQ